MISLIMLNKLVGRNFTLLGAWNALKRVHHRAQPNDGFAKILLELDGKFHGKVSIEWQQLRSVMEVCSICGKNAGLSSSSLKLSFVEITQEPIIWERRYRHDYGNTKGFGCTQD